MARSAPNPIGPAAGGWHCRSADLAGILSFHQLFGAASRRYNIKMVDACFIPHPMESGRWVELRYSRPVAPPPWPAIVLVHGHQWPWTPGARDLVDSGRFGPWVSRELLTVAVSQPGYGGSDGPPDYCGPRSQEAVRAVLRWAIDVGADPRRLALYGVSRGAITGAMAATAEPYPAALVLQAGIYDMASEVAFLEATAKTPGMEGLRGILTNIEREAGLDEASLLARSALQNAGAIRSPTLLLHGARDPQCPPDGAVALADRISRNGVASRCIIVPDAEHRIPGEHSLPPVVQFLNEVGILASA